jgi:hypothetical protein
VVTDEHVIVLGKDADPLEVKAARLLADRAGERLGRTPAVVSDAPVDGTPHVVLGTPSSSALVRAAVETGDLRLGAALGEEGFALRTDAGPGALVAAHDPHGLVNGVGRLLRESSFTGGSWRMPGAHALHAVPQRPLRPIYFATHLGNWYTQASDDELHRYIDDLALCGFNALVTWFDFHHHSSFDDGAAAWERLCKLDGMAREAGMKIGRIAIVNESFDGQAAPELRAVGRLGNTGWATDLCPSIPEARRIILANRREFLERTLQSTSLDWLCLWPYDQGGCNCERCMPWPATYYELAREIAELTADVSPATEVQLSAWWIGQHRPEEDEQLFEQLKRGERWFQTIVVGSAELRRWRAAGLQVPDAYRLLLFPEISMFDDRPWGSRGANPAPRKFAAQMAEFAPDIAGAVPYSEGRFEDVNKAVWAQLMWDPSADPLQLVEGYCRYEFGADVAADAARLILAIEEGSRNFSNAAERRDEAVRLGAIMDERARASWRWELIRSRPAIDALRWELEEPLSDERRADVHAELRRLYEHLQHDLYLHDAEQTARGWLYLPFDVWITMPLNWLYPPAVN